MPHEGPFLPVKHFMIGEDMSINTLFLCPNVLRKNCVVWSALREKKYIYVSFKISEEVYPGIYKSVLP